MNWLYHLLFISDAGYWIGAILLGLAASVLLWMVTSPETRMGPDPVIPSLADVPTVEFFIEPADHGPAPNWIPWEFVPDEAVVIDITDTVEIHAVADPLTVTAQIERVDEETPLFYQIRRPKPLELDSYTEGITRAQIARALEAGRPQ